jgi:hypothetical protein
MTVLALPAAAAVGLLASGLGRRVAGGLWGQTIPGGDYPTRLLWGVTVALPAWLAGMPRLPALCLIPAVFLGCSIGYARQSMRVGDPTLRWPEKAGAILGSLEHGIGGMALPALVAAWAGTWHGWAAFVAAGVSCPFWYWLAYRVPWSPQLLGVYRDDRPPMAELMWGGAVGIAAAVAGAMAS